MPRFTLAQRAEIVKKYYKNFSSVASTQREFRRELGRHHGFSVQAIRRTMEKFEREYTLLDLKPQTRQKLVRNEENIAAVMASIEEKPEMSIRSRSAELGIARESIRLILLSELNQSEFTNQTNKKPQLNMADKPKRPLSAYMLWLNSAREQIKKENPGIKVTEVAKKGGELWRSMKDKSEWEAKAAKCKEDYEEAVREFEANGGSTANGAGKKRGKTSKKAPKKNKKDASDDDDDDVESE